MWILKLSSRLDQDMLLHKNTTETVKLPSFSLVGIFQLGPIKSQETNRRYHLSCAIWTGNWRRQGYIDGVLMMPSPVWPYLQGYWTGRVSHPSRLWCLTIVPPLGDKRVIPGGNQTRQISTAITHVQYDRRSHFWQLFEERTAKGKRQMDKSGSIGKLWERLS